MALLSLIAKLGLDTSSFDAAVDKVNSKVTNKLGGNLTKAFVGAVTGATFVRLISGAAEYAQGLKNLADTHGITVEQVQILQQMAQDAGMTFDKYAESITNTGKSLSEFVRMIPASGDSVKMLTSDVNTAVSGLMQIERLKNNVLSFVGNAIGSAGTLMQGFQDAMGASAAGKTDGKSMWQLVKESVEKRNQAEMDKFGGKSLIASADNPIPRSTGETYGPSGDRTGIEIERKTSMFIPQVDSLQRMGAYSSQTGGAVTEIKTTNQILRKIDGTITRIAAPDPNKEIVYDQ